MNGGSQGQGSVAVAVAGVAGSGKSTLGRALAAHLRLPLVDLDSVTNPLLDSLPAGLLGGHWLASEHAAAVRSGRYAALRAVARDVLGTVGGVVLVAPFTAELRGDAAWDDLLAALGGTPLRLVHLVGDPGLLASRRAQRGAPRDAHRPADEVVTPAVPVIPLEASLPPAEQLRLALLAIAADPRSP